jgi:dynactin complex subunit
MAEADIHKYYEAARTINNKTLLSTKKYIPDAGDRSNAGKLESTYQNIYKSDLSGYCRQVFFLVQYEKKLFMPV